MSGMMNILDQILMVEERYLRNNVSREYLLTFVKQARKEYESIKHKESERDIVRFKMALFFILKRIRQRIIFENRLIEIVDSEAGFITENMRHLLFETMRINSGPPGGFRLMQNVENNRNGRPRTRANFPMDISQLLRSWLKENMDNPYPSDAEKAYLCQKTGLGPAQINNWFINARRRILPFMKGKYVNFQ